MKASGGLVCQGVIDGNNGSNGYNTIAVAMYRRSASALGNNDRPTGTLTYTFSTGKVSGASSYFNGWSQTIPATQADTKLYVIMAVARSQSDTDEIAASDWSTPVEYVADGMNSAVVTIYKRSASQPTDKPDDDAIYTFATGALTGTLNGWSTSIPATDGNPCWVRQAMAVSTGSNDTILAEEWSNPATKLVEDGAKGDPGGNTATIFLYRRSATAVTSVGTLPTLYYKFSTKRLYTDEACTTLFSGQNGWYQDIPSGSNPIYVTTAVAYSTTNVDTIGNTEWVSPIQFTENGEHGVNTAPIFLYKRSATAITAHGITKSLYYKFADGVLYKEAAATNVATDSDLNNWSRFVPSGNDPCYIIQASALSQSDTDEIAKTDWSTPVKYVESGTSPWIADGNNEMDSVATNLSGVVTSSKTIYDTIKLFHGATEESFTFQSIKRNGTTLTWDGNNSNVWPRTSGKVLSIEYDTNAAFTGEKDEYEILIQSTSDASITRTVRLVVNGIRPGATGEAATLYNLVPSVSEIIHKKNNTFSPTSLSCYCTSLKNGTATNNPSEATVQWSYTGADNSWTNIGPTGAVPSSNVYNNGGRLYLRLLVGSKVMDKETIPVVSEGADGDDAQYIYLRGTGWNNSATRVLNITSTTNLFEDYQSRGLVAARINRNTLEVSDITWFDVYGGTSEGSESISNAVAARNNFVTYLTNTTNEYFLVVASYDAIGINSSMVSKLKEFGLGTVDGTYIVTNSDYGFRTPFAFLGFKGLQQGYALYQFKDTEATTPRAEVMAYVKNGVFMSSKDGDKAPYEKRDYRRYNSRETNAYGEPAGSTDMGYWATTAPATTASYPYIWERICSYDKDDVLQSTSYVCLTGLQGGTGNTGRMYYMAGTYTGSKKYERTDTLCPVVYYGGSYWYLDVDESTGNTPNNSSEYWKKLNDLQVVLTEAIFVKEFAQFGSAIITGDWLISVHGKINDVSYGGTVESPETYDGYPAYSYFDPSTPQGNIVYGTNSNSKEFTNNSYNASDAIKINSFYLTPGRKLFSVDGDCINGNMYAALFKEGSKVAGTEVVFNMNDTVWQKTFIVDIEGGNYELRAYTDGGMACNINGLSKYTFAPNYCLDLKRGIAYQTTGVLSGFLRKSPTNITTTNINQYKRDDIQSATVLDFDKCGSFIRLYPGTSTYFSLPLLSSALKDRYTLIQKDQIRGFVGTKIILYNRSGLSVNVVIKYTKYGNGVNQESYTLNNGNCAELECYMDRDENDGTEIICWKVNKTAEPV